MTTATTSGTASVTDSETTIKEYSTEAERFVDFTLFTHLIEAADTFVFKVYKKDASGGTYRKFAEDTFVGVQALPAVYYPLMSGKFGIKITGQRTAGTNRDILWQSVEVT